MKRRGKIFGISISRHLLAVALVFASFLPFSSITTLNAASGERTLYLFYTHTNETKRITFRRNGRYDQAGLNTLNQFLRDWRRNEPTRMDPALFDLLWQVYQDVGAREPIHVVSAYRSSQTNEMLRSRSSAVAKNSRHTMGMAMDFYIPGIAISKLREAAMRRQVGGVGYYPTSGNPFVHLDTGNVRAWPRMTRTQLARIFPRGRTLHLPSDGVPLSADGRRYATNEWGKCHSVPCVGSNSNTTPSNSGGNSNSNSGSNSGSGRTLMDLFFGSNNDSEVTTTVVAANAPTRRTVTAITVTPPTPAARAEFLDFRTPLEAPTPLDMPQTILVATGAAPAILPDSSLTQSGRPAPRVLISPPPDASNVLTAYAPVIQPEPDAQRALQMLIERRNTATVTPPTVLPVLRGSIITASLGHTPATPQNPVQDIVPALPDDKFAELFSNTFATIARTQPKSVAGETNIALAVLASNAHNRRLPINMRDVELFAPDLDHVADTMVMHTVVANAHFAIMFEPDEGDFDPATELGPHSVQINFSLLENRHLLPNRFSPVAPIITTDI